MPIGCQEHKKLCSVLIITLRLLDTYAAKSESPPPCTFPSITQLLDHLSMKEICKGGQILQYKCLVTLRWPAIAVFLLEKLINKNVRICFTFYL